MLIQLFVALSLIGCVKNEKTSQPGGGVALGIPVVIPESVWGRKFFQLDPSFVCHSDGGDVAPGYRKAMLFSKDRRILEMDPCTQAEQPLTNQNGLEFSRDGFLVGHLDRLFQLRQDPKNAAEPYIEGFCTNSLVQDETGQTTPVEMRLSATAQPSMASFSWTILGENYVSLVTENLMMARAQNHSNRTYTATADQGGASVEILLAPDAAKNNLYPAFYRMANGVAFDLYCRLSR